MSGYVFIMSSLLMLCLNSTLLSIIGLFQQKSSQFIFLTFSVVSQKMFSSAFRDFFSEWFNVLQKESMNQ